VVSPVDLDKLASIEADNAPKPRSNLGRVRYDNKREAILALELKQEIQQRTGGGGIKCARWFICEDDIRLLQERAYHGNPLALASGELGWFMRCTFGKPYALKEVVRPRNSIR
jgi:hypothetical protein